MNIRTKRLLLCGAVALVVATTADRHVAAWGAPGHRIVARIAWEQMTPAARSAANDLLEHGGPDAFYAAATWADEIRSARPETYNWVIRLSLASRCP